MRMSSLYRKAFFRPLALLSILIVAVFGVHSCEEMLTFDVDCNECYFPEPDSADIMIYVTINNDIDHVPLIIYKGKADARNIEYIDTAYSETYYLYVKTNEYYSVEATYQHEGKTVIAGDGDKLVTRHITDVCSEECYVIRKGIMNVRLKK
jgi:hypothetical protein